MKLESVVFLLCGLFLELAAIGYILATDFEPAGSVALVLSGGLCLFVGGYFWFIRRRIDERPEDREDGEIIEGAGDLGFFAPASYYPIGLAAVIVIMGVGVAFWYPWVMVVGAVAILGMVCGLTFEFYTGQNKEHDHGEVAEHV
ncbi:MAG: cytochrome c oxidase subunit 4 [Cumulibacter sp.]